MYALKGMDRYNGISYTSKIIGKRKKSQRYTII